MRLTISLFAALLFTSVSFCQTVNIIPQPASLEIKKGTFIISANTYFLTLGSGMENSVGFLNGYLKDYYGFQLKKETKPRLLNVIILNYERMDNNLPGAYRMDINKDNIEINAYNEQGLFYAIQSLIQLLPVDKNKPVTVPQLSIVDSPRFAYRGMHLDVCRHFFPVDFIKKYIDYLALYKFNIFHWHLTDDQGWRIEIKKYPKLTSVGGWRNGTIIGRYPGTGNDGLKYGGYYTQQEIKEVVKYAAERYITIIPEIEMPGHSSGAIAAYPELSCFPNESTQHPKQCAWSGNTTGKQVQQTWGVFDDVFCAGKENTFKVLEDVMDEVLALFPSKMIHVGGDECPKSNWKRCPYCQQRMKDNGLKDEHELQSYFIQRMEKYLNGKGRTLIGWDEILEGGLAPNAAVMSWRGEEGGIAAAQQNHEVVMTPGGWLYFDHSQSQNEDSVTIGGYTPLEKTYSYEPVAAALNSEQAKHILGAQANVWTEYMAYPSKVEYMIFPRMSALSEVLWSPKEKRNWNDFEKRLKMQFKRYDLWKANYSKAYFDLKATVLPTEDYNGVVWKIQSKYSRPTYEYCYIQISEYFIYKKDTEIFDTIAVTDTNDPSKIVRYDVKKTMMKAGENGIRLGNSPWVDDTVAIIKIDDSETVRALQRFHHTRGQEIEQKFNFNKATAKKITLTTSPSDKYPGDGAFTLVNGVQNEKGLARSSEFLGFEGTDCEAVIDLGKTDTINTVIVHLLNQQASWIWRPQYAEVFSSTDGKNFTSLKMTDDLVPAAGNNATMKIEFYPLSTRFIKVVVKNWGDIPAGNPGAGNKAWLFVDEIEVN